MTVRAKFYIEEITRKPSGTNKVKLRAVARGERNAEWAKASPDGSIELTISNPAAFEFFADLLDSMGTDPSGHPRYPEVFVDFSPATDGWLGDGHAFVESKAPADHYSHGQCAECGFPRDRHG